MQGHKVPAILAVALLCSAASDPAMDKDNPTCPAQSDWGQAKAMTLTPADRDGKRVLIADGIIDSRLPARMKAALDADPRISEIWLRSRGGDARAGNATGLLIRKQYPGMTTRIPSGWTCFSACNFVFMGGDLRYVDPGGIFMVHMFTHTTSERDAIDLSVDEGASETTKLIGQIEQSSAMLASADNDFLIRMGISRKLLTDIMYRQQAVATDADRSTRYCLSQAEVRKYNVMPTTSPAG